MRTRKQLMTEYELSHRNPINSLIHYLCVPLIVASTLGLAWCVPVGRWLNLPEGYAAFVNLATIAALPIGLFYLRLSLGSLVTMMVWFGASVAGILALEAAGLSVLLISAVVWVASWALQIYGHKIEGAKPSAADDVVFFLIGPLFVTDKLTQRLGLHA
ncbi:MAG TPA: Mpo1-like protein [Solimonas sp.]